MTWPLPYSMLPYPIPRAIPPPLMIQPPRETDLPIDLSISGKHKLPTPPPTPSTPSSIYSSECLSPRFDSMQSSGVHHNEQERTFDCVDCNYTTRRRTNLKRHIHSMHSRKEVVECCGTYFHNKAEFRAHVKKVHLNGYKCHLCSRSFCRKALLKRHMSVHSGIKEFNCKLCSYATSHKSNLERHQRVHTRNNNTVFQEVEAKFQFPPCSPPPSMPATMATPPSPPESDAEKAPELDIKKEVQVQEPKHETDQEQVVHNDRLLALRVATEEVIALQETSKMMPGSQRLCAWPYKCVQCVQRFKTQQALTLHEIQLHPNRRADAFLSFPLKYQLKIVYSAITQARENLKQD